MCIKECIARDKAIREEETEKDQHTFFLPPLLSCPPLSLYSLSLFSLSLSPVFSLHSCIYLLVACLLNSIQSPSLTGNKAHCTSVWANKPYYSYQQHYQLSHIWQMSPNENQQKSHLSSHGALWTSDRLSLPTDSRVF